MTNNCSYHCNNGKYFDASVKRIVPCPECTAARTNEVRSGKTEEGASIREILHFGSEYNSHTLDTSKIVSKSQASVLEAASVSGLKASVEELYNLYIIGDLPRYSMCFGVDKLCNMDNIVVPLLLGAYKAGLTVCPFISASEYRVKILKEEANNRNLDLTDNFREIYLYRDVVLMQIPSGSTEFDILEAKGLMQARAASGKGTVLITTRPREMLSEILCSSGDEPSFYSAKGSFVRYPKEGTAAANRTASAKRTANFDPTSVTLDSLRISHM